MPSTSEIQAAGQGVPEHNGSICQGALHFSGVLCIARAALFQLLSQPRHVGADGLADFGPLEGAKCAAVRVSRILPAAIVRAHDLGAEERHEEAGAGRRATNPAMGGQQGGEELGNAGLKGGGGLHSVAAQQPDGGEGHGVAAQAATVLQVLQDRVYGLRDALHRPGCHRLAHGNRVRGPRTITTHREHQHSHRRLKDGEARREQKPCPGGAVDRRLVVSVGLGIFFGGRLCTRGVSGRSW
mmetsp:Transcript_12513/g.35149  ORF Transcript_12513/g.35149 Transcript_12513/m.35149 type:complete len:241 (-) Transcript_12513:1410-2132(-)